MSRATVPGEVITTENGVKMIGSTTGRAASPAPRRALYARNLLTFLTTFWDKEAKAPKLAAEDEIVQGVMLTRGGAVVHPSFAARQGRLTSTGGLDGNRRPNHRRDRGRADAGQQAQALAAAPARARRQAR